MMVSKQSISFKSIQYLDKFDLVSHVQHPLQQLGTASPKFLQMYMGMVSTWVKQGANIRREQLSRWWCGPARHRARLPTATFRAPNSPARRMGSWRIELSSQMDTHLAIQSNDLGKEVTIMLAFINDNMRGLYQDCFPAVWNISKFGKTGAYSFQVTYTNQLAFSKPQITDGTFISAETSIQVNIGQKTTLTQNNDVYHFSPPQPGSPGFVQAMNNTGIIQDIVVDLQTSNPRQLKDRVVCSNNGLHYSTILLEMTDSQVVCGMLYETTSSMTSLIVLLSARRATGDSSTERTPANSPFSTVDREAWALVLVISGKEDPLAFHPKPQSLVDNEQHSDEDRDTRSNVEDLDGVYRPPNLAPMPYDKRYKRQPVPNALSTLLYQDPWCLHVEGTSGLGSMPSLSSDRAREIQRIEDSEKENFTRLVMKKKDARRRQKGEEDLALGGTGAGKDRKRG
ncbi:hypothetical protein BD769DRAFT_1694884 [Suillus cothurnatus]|nr:hypothetical protein BD769DRAFT_1694884 [Suillus cothurnatus]